MTLCHTQNYLNFDHYYVVREADIREQCWGEVAKNQKIYSGFFLPGYPSHLKSSVANRSPSVVELKREVSEIKKKIIRGSAEVPQQHKQQKDLTDNPALRLQRVCPMFLKVSNTLGF